MKAIYINNWRHNSIWIGSNTAAEPFTVPKPLILWILQLATLHAHRRPRHIRNLVVIGWDPPTTSSSQNLYVLLVDVAFASLEA
jgi:hypothetical protein